MGYVFDSSSLITLFVYYYYERFPSLWQNFNNLVKSKKLLSVREVKLELQNREGRLSDWVKKNDDLFAISSNK